MSIVTGVLNQTISGIYVTSRDGYGRITKTELFTDVPCRWQERFEMVLDKTGNEVVARIQVWIPEEWEDTVLDVEDGYIFTYKGVDYTVIAYENHYNMLGDREYIKVFLR